MTHTHLTLKNFEKRLLEKDDVVITGNAYLPGPFPISELATQTIAASHRQAASYGKARGLSLGRVQLDRLDATAAFRSERYIAVNGMAPAELWSPLSGYYECTDGWVQLHTNYPHHRNAVLRVTQSPDDRDSVARAIKTKSRFEIESAVLAEGGCAFACRSREEWLQTAQARDITGLPLISIEQVSACAPNAALKRSPKVHRPLVGVKVLDLTHVIAGPVCTRTLAAYGAEVLRISAHHLPTLLTADIDTGFGKRWQCLNVKLADEREQFLQLVKQAHVVVQGFRPGSFDAIGVGPHDLFETNPQLVVVTLSAWSHVGEWSHLRGYDSLVQTATGIAHEGARLRGIAKPHPLPAQAIDHATGYLMSAATIYGLNKQLAQGGGWHVRASLAQTGHWLWQLMSALPPVPFDQAEIDSSVVRHLLTDTNTPYGKVTHLKPVGSIEGADLCWDYPPPMKPHL